MSQTVIPLFFNMGPISFLSSFTPLNGAGSLLIIPTNLILPFASSLITLLEIQISDKNSSEGSHPPIHRKTRTAKPVFYGSHI